MRSATSPIPNRPALLNGYRAVTHVLAVLVLLQTVIAGRSENIGYGDWSIVPHGILGNLSFLLAVAALVLAIISRSPRSVVAVAAVLTVLMTVQIGLGYSAAEAREAGSWHILNGVLIFGVVVYQITQSRRVAADSTE